MVLHVVTSRLLGQLRRGLEKGKHRINLPSLTLWKDLLQDRLDAILRDPKHFVYS